MKYFGSCWSGFLSSVDFKPTQELPDNHDRAQKDAMHPTTDYTCKHSFIRRTVAGMASS